MKNTLLVFFSISILFFVPKFSIAQLEVSTIGSAEELAQSLVGSGVTISNVTLVCADGGWGGFNGQNCNIGLDSGIVLACGDITNMVGPNISSGITTDFQTPGDADLDDISAFPTHDACVLEFDLTVLGDSVKFNYSFGSDEYTEWVNTSFNDVFAFLISGPGIIGSKNIALVPNTSNPVAINTVNCLNGSPYYICNDPNNFSCPGSYNCPTDYNTTTLEYDGFTTVLTARTAVVPCETYHLKLAVADASDGVLDSGVWIQAGSLNSSSTSVQIQAPYVDPDTNQPGIVEGCFDGQFDFFLSNDAIDTVTIYYSIGGTATSGADYIPFLDSLQILPGDDQGKIVLTAVVDGITEGQESVTIYLFLACSTEPYDSATIYIYDEFKTEGGPDTTICVGESIQLHAKGAVGGAWLWTPAIGLSCTVCKDPIATPLITTDYIVSSTLGNCTAYDTVTIIVDNPLPVNAGPDVSICEGQSIQLNAINGNSFTWTPSTGLSCDNCSYPLASPSSTTTYSVFADNACFSSSDDVIVTVNPSPIASVSDDVTVCPNTPVNLFASGGITYSWSPVDGLSDPDIANPVAIVDQTTSYTVSVFNSFGCTDAATVTINVYDIPSVVITPYPDTTIYLGNNVDLTVTGGTSYNWFPSTYLTDPNSSTPTSVQPQDTIVYYVTVVSDNGCIRIDSVTINVRWDALVVLPSAFSPDAGVNSIFHVIVRGIFTLNHFNIYNRWGQMVFTTNDINAGWDGKFKGKAQPVGVYVYEVSGTDHVGNTISRKGNVTLVR
ncbi:MAG: choice-of-anchor L domain-containing protein [Chitinophagales bacterium]|nr:choice-of-anchor L domain-containing protein [Chitinophagales bacterium]